MLLAEYNYEEDIAVQRAEEHEIAFAEGIEQGSHQAKRESARILKQLHCATAMIMQVTGLRAEEIETL